MNPISNSRIERGVLWLAHEEGLPMSRAGWSVRGMISLFLTAMITVTASGCARVAMAQPTMAGRVRVLGIVTYDGPLPDPIPIPEAGTVRHLIEVDTRTKGLKDAVIWLEGIPTPQGATREAPEEPVVMDQQNYAFVPHVLAVEAGREVEFRNSDAANHGVTASSPEPKNRFDVVTPPGGRQSYRFVASKSPVAIGCPIHGMMAAWVYVFDHPYHAVTGARGEFRLPPVPPGRYTLQVRHPDGGMQRQEKLVVWAGEPLRLRIDFHGDDRKSPGRAGRGSSR
jgi:plastocyanin